MNHEMQKCKLHKCINQHINIVKRIEWEIHNSELIITYGKNSQFRLMTDMLIMQMQNFAIYCERKIYRVTKIMTRKINSSRTRGVPCLREKK